MFHALITASSTRPMPGLLLHSVPHPLPCPVPHLLPCPVPHPLPCVAPLPVNPFHLFVTAQTDGELQ